MLTHEFGILKNISELDNFNTYEPRKYNCIKIDDENILSQLNRFKLLKTYHHSLSRPSLGLAYHGITLIPTESLSSLLEIFISTSDRIDNIDEVYAMINEAINSKSFIIHFGI